MTQPNTAFTSIQSMSRQVPGSLTSHQSRC